MLIASTLSLEASMTRQGPSAPSGMPIRSSEETTCMLFLTR